LLFTLAVPPVTAFLFESDLDFEKSCYVSYIKRKTINCFTSTLGHRFDRYLGEKSVVANVPQGLNPSLDSRDRLLRCPPRPS